MQHLKERWGVFFLPLGSRIPTMKADEVDIKTLTLLKPTGGSNAATPSTRMMRALRKLRRVTWSSCYSARKYARRGAAIQHVHHSGPKYFSDFLRMCMTLVDVSQSFPFYHRAPV